MSKIQRRKIAPFISVFILVAALLGYVFMKMETVRQGYELVRLGHYQKTESQRKASLQLTYMRLTRPERLNSIGTTRLALTQARKNQVIIMAATGLYIVRQ